MSEEREITQKLFVATASHIVNRQKKNAVDTFQDGPAETSD